LPCRYFNDESVPPAIFILKGADYQTSRNKHKVPEPKAKTLRKAA
jgi:hypothetical protein